MNAAGDTFSDIDLAPLAMGGLTKGVSVKAMAQAYASFANEGVWREARTYTKVVDADGKVVLNNTQQSHVAMKDMTAWYTPICWKTPSNPAPARRPIEI